MDVTDLLGNSVTVEVVKSSASKTLVILSPGAMKKFSDGKEKLNLLVEMDGRQLNWTPNRASMKAIAEKYGKESNLWPGKKIVLNIGLVNGKEAVIASAQ